MPREIPKGVERFEPDFDTHEGEIPNGQVIFMCEDEQGDWIKVSDLDKIEAAARASVVGNIVDAWAEGDKACPALQETLERIEAAVGERVREGLKAARRDTDGAPFLDAARALCPDEAHWEDEGWRRYADDASACIDAFLAAAFQDSYTEQPEQLRVIANDASRSDVERVDAFLKLEPGAIASRVANEVGIPHEDVMAVFKARRSSYTEQGGGTES